MKTMKIEKITIKRIDKKDTKKVLLFLMSDEVKKVKNISCFLFRIMPNWLTVKISLRVRGFFVYKIKQGETTVGYMSLISNNNTVHLDDIKLIKEYRGFGIGTKVINKIYLITNKITLSALDGSLSFFEKLGFEKLKTLTVKGCNFHKMELM